jgi:hypothetical protein
MVAQERRSSPSRAGEALRDGGPTEAASFVAEAVSELALLARRHRLETLAFLLDMAKLEAEELVRSHLARGLR